MRSKSNLTRNGMIAEAIALFVRNEAALLAQVAETNKAHAEGERRWLEMKAETNRALVEGERRFARIETDLEQIKAVLRQLAATVDRHERILSDLPDAIRQKIGFKAKS